MSVSTLTGPEDVNASITVVRPLGRVTLVDASGTIQARRYQPKGRAVTPSCSRRVPRSATTGFVSAPSRKDLDVDSQTL